ncbi:MAG: hypothetical protein H0X47_21545 [Nitrospirales bacterium]|nr:hypothetical protein [Nitrospirales bacterium]
MVHDIVRQEMLRVYQQRAVPIYLDKPAKSIFDEGIECFHTLRLDKVKALQTGNTVQILPWLGDRITNTLTVLLRGGGLAADCFGGVIDIRDSSIESFQNTVETILQGAKPKPVDLANGVPDTIVEKYDPVLPKELRDLGYGAKFFDVDGAGEWLGKLKC